MFVRWLPLPLLLAGCPEGDDPTRDSDTSGDDTAVTDTETTPTVDLDGTAGDLQDLLRELSDAFPGYGDAAARLLDAYNGGTPDGVTLSAPGSVRSGTLSVDYDLDGTYDEDFEISLFADEPNGPVTVYASTGYYRLVNASRNMSVTLSADETGLDATNGTVDLWEGGLSVHASNGTFRFAPGAAAGESAGSMAYVAYTAAPNSIISGAIDVISDGSAGYTVEVSYASGTARIVPGHFSQPLGCGAAIEKILYADYCAQGPTPANLLLPGAFVAFLARRRR